MVWIGGAHSITLSPDSTLNSVYTPINKPNSIDLAILFKQATACFGSG